MDPISPQTVEDVREEFRGIQSPQLKEHAAELHDLQPELMAFVQASVNELDQRPADLCVYLFLVICRMYKENYEEGIPLARPEDIIENYKENEQEMQRVGEDQRPFDPSESGQPGLMKYISKALARADQNADGEGEKLSDGEKAFIFLILKTVIDVLDEKIAEGRQ